MVIAAAAAVVVVEKEVMARVTAGHAAARERMGRALISMVVFPRSEAIASVLLMIAAAVVAVEKEVMARVTASHAAARALICMVVFL